MPLHTLNGAEQTHSVGFFVGKGVNPSLQVKSQGFLELKSVAGRDVSRDAILRRGTFGNGVIRIGALLMIRRVVHLVAR